MTIQVQLPIPETRDGDTRRVGVEVELGGLSEHEVCDIISETLGGSVEQRAAYEWRALDTELGNIDVLFDTALRDHATSAAALRGLELGRAVIPVEYITEPLLPDDLTQLDTLNNALASAGARGTEDGIALGFGVHLNVATAGLRVEDVLPMLQAFALCEDWLRGHLGIDPARRILPFIAPYDAAAVDAFTGSDADSWTIDDLIDTYLRHAGSRNHALDLLPVLKEIDATRVTDAVPAMGTKTARPAFHYRLPDCRIDDPEWSVTGEWRIWCGIERVASDTRLLSDLRQAWRDYRGALSLPGRWHAVSAPVIERSKAFL